MELAIPILALGGLYVVSNQNSNKKKPSSSKEETRVEKEEFTNMGAKRNYLPNVDELPQNYPIVNKNQLADTVQNYSNPNVASDKYFNQNNYENLQNKGVKVGNEIQDIYSLTGDYLDSSNFKHNNMIPFYGAKIKGQLYDANIAESILDNMAGTGSQVIKKIEQAPLFKPQENMQWANGAPNMSDFYQSRVNPGMKISNVKPFDSEYVGPGLNKGYTSEGSGGYNAGMEARNEWLPKNVDELRVATNPKLEYSLANHEGPSYSNVKNVGIEGKVEKYRPDTFYIQTQDRWLTTTGQEKGQMLQPVQEVHDTMRNATTRSYTGVAAPSEKNAGYVGGEHEETKRKQLLGTDVAICSAVGRGTHEDTDNRQNNYTTYVNNRTLQRQPDTMRSGFGRTIGAVIAPIMDMMKPTRKSEYSSNVRVYGDAGSKVASNYVNNPNDTTPTTIKETTLYSPNFYINTQTEGGGYMVAEQQAITNQRDSTTCSSIGNAGGYSSRWGDMNYSAAYMQTNNTTKEPSTVARTNHGSNQIYNQTMNVNVAKIDSDRDNTRMWVPNNMGYKPMVKENYGHIRTPQQYDQSMNCDRISPDLLNAFRNNPFTHSLTSAV
jgi:putative hemolysin